MSSLALLYSTLNADAGVRAIVGEATSPQHSRIYPGHAPESAEVPFITYQLVSGNRFDTLPGVGDMQRQLIQMNCVQTTPELAHALADAVYAALEGNGWQSGKIDLYQPDTDTHTVALDWIFHA